MGKSVSPISSRAAQLATQRRLPRIVKMELILTEACNLGCTYCFEYGVTNRQSMSSKTAFAAVDFLIDASRNSEWVGITFMGGEPMLCHDLIEEVVRYAKRRANDSDKRITFDMTTNGVLLEERHLQFFRREGIRYCLSLDGNESANDRHRKTRAGNGTFDMIAGKMKLFKKYQHWQGARMTVMPDTASHLHENIRFLHEELAINQFIIGFATHIEWSDRQIADYNQGLKETFEYYLEQRLSKESRRLRIGLLEVGEISEAYLEAGGCGWGCGAGSGRLAVSPNGRFHGCSKLAWGPGGSKDAPLPLGDVETGLSQLDNRLKLLNHTEDPRIKCRSCEIKAFCNGGCYAANYADTGNIYLPSGTYCKLIFAQKNACDYGRTRLKNLGLRHVNWRSGVTELEGIPECVKIVTP